MNKIYKIIWIKSLGIWVVASEKSRSSGKASRSVVSTTRTGSPVQSTLFCVASLLSAGDAFAACLDNASNVFATGGSKCEANLTDYFGTNTAYSTGDQSVLTFTQKDVTISANHANVHVLGAGGSNAVNEGPSAQVIATGNLSVYGYATNTGSNTRAIYLPGGTNAKGEKSRLIVYGNLLAYKGSSAAAIQNDGSDIEVFGKTTFISGNSNIRGTADGFRNNGGTNTFHDLLTVTVNSSAALAGTSGGRGIAMTGGTINILGGANINTLAGTALALSGGTVTTHGVTNITSQTATAVVMSSAAILDTSAGQLNIKVTGGHIAGMQLASTSTANLGATTITTLGEASPGITIVNAPTSGSTLLLNQPLTIETFGADSYGIKSLYNTANTIMLPSGSTILTHGDNADGFHLTAPSGDTPSVVLASDTKITTEGSSANAIFLGADAGAVSLTSAATLTTSGANSNGIRISTASNGGTIANSGLILSAANGIYNSASGILTLNNSGTIKAPTVILNMLGTLSTTNTATGVLQGVVENASGQLNLNNAGTWINTGNSTLSTLANSGAITYTAPDNNVFKTITTDSYTGNNGQINIHTVLGSDGSLSDQLVLKGGTASGKSRIAVTNVSGSGDKTTGNGILVVDAQSGATTTTDAFALTGPVIAGAYDYSLVRNGNESWYLVSKLVTVPSAIIKENPENYRQETSLYAALSPLAALYSSATMDSWHERIGGASDVVGQDNNTSRLWGRVIGSSGVRDGDKQGIHGTSGPAFDYKTVATQIGGNIYRSHKDDGASTVAGAYLTIGNITGDVDHFTGQNAGRAQLDVYSIGGYWTSKNAQGGYVDVVGQVNYYKAKATSTRMAALRTNGKGFDLSIEAGLPVHLDTNWRVEPQLQLRTMRADLGNGEDAAGLINLGTSDSLVGRAGIKLTYQSDKVTAWGRLDVLNEFRGKSQITVSSLENLHAVNFDSSLHGKSAALTAGIDAKLTGNASLYGAASYQRAFGDNRGHAVTVQGGLKIVW